MILSEPYDSSRPIPAGGPIEAHEAAVLPEWIDYNGHMNVAYYVLAFDHALDGFLDWLDVGAGYAERTGNSTFVLETHVTYAQEVKEGDPLRFTLQLLDADEKRLHLFLQMFHKTEGYLAATSEQMVVHVDLEARRIAPFPDDRAVQIDAVRAAHAALARPVEAGQVIGIRRRSDG